MTVRMGGIQSGMDTEALVQTMIDAESHQIRRNEEKIVELEDDLYAWNALDSSLASLGSITADLSAYTAWGAKSVTSGDSEIVTATAEVGSLTGSYEIDVTNLAVAHSINGDSIEDTSLGIDHANGPTGLTGSFEINGQAVEFEPVDSLHDIAYKINLAGNEAGRSGAAPFEAIVIDKTLVIRSGEEGLGNELIMRDTSNVDEGEVSLLDVLGILDASVPAYFADQSDDQKTVRSADITRLGYTNADTDLEMDGTFSLVNSNGESLTIAVDTGEGAATATLQQIADAIDSDDLFSATIEDGELVVSSIDGASIIGFDDPDQILARLGITSAINTAHETLPEDLEATVEGIPVTAKKNSGVDTILAGVNLNFKAEGKATVNVQNETEEIKGLILQFVDEYNSTMELIEELAAVDVADTGEVTAAGLLQGEMLVTSIQSNSRSMVTSQVEFLGEEFNSLLDIGIYTTGIENRLEVIDESKLDDALANNFDEVEDLFRHVNYDDSGNVVSSGVLRQYDDYIMELTQPLDGRIALRTEAIGADITSRQNYITRKTEDMIRYEAALWDNFANMEAAMSSIQSGGDYLMQTLGV